jgi:protein phosphatase
LQALTREQTVAGELAATMSAEQAALLPTRYQHMLTQCVGVDAALEPDFLDLELRPDDRLLLCTDGVSRTLGEDTLAHRLADAGSPRACVRDLFRAVWRMGAPDNLTAVVVDIGD